MSLANFVPALKLYTSPRPNLEKRWKSSLNLCSYCVIKMIEATCQHKSASCTVINNTEPCLLQKTCSFYASIILGTRSSSQGRRIAPNTNLTSSLFSNKEKLANDKKQWQVLFTSPSEAGKGCDEEHPACPTQINACLASRLMARPAISRDGKGSAPWLTKGHF